MYGRRSVPQDMPALLPGWWPLGETGGGTGLIVSRSRGSTASDRLEPALGISGQPGSSRTPDPVLTRPVGERTLARASS